MADTLVVEAITKSYGDIRAVDGVSFAVASGEIFGLLGPNGAGKTTTVEIAEGLREPDGGEVRLFGQAVWPRNGGLLPRIGVQLQASAFFDRLTAGEQLATFAALYGAPADRVGATLAEVGLSGHGGVRVEKLSGGQTQRLAIACAFVHDPDVLFLDEPSAGLDPQSRQHLWEVIRNIAVRGKTVVMTTHYMDEAEVLCDRVAIMDAGRVLALAAPARLVRDLDAPVHVVVPFERCSASAARDLPGADTATTDGVSTTIVTRSRVELLRALDERGVLADVEVRGANLEDVFLTLTGREYRS